MTLVYREIARDVQNYGTKAVCEAVVADIKENRIRLANVSIRNLAESLIPDGREWVRSLDGVEATESISAIDSTAFSNVTGQLLINEIMDAYQSPVFSISALFRTMSSRLSGERIPGISKIGDQTESVAEGMPYPSVGLGEDYIDTPPTVKRGVIVPVTKETIFFDRTGVLLTNAREVGESLAIDKEKRCCDVMIGAINNHKWKGTAYNTYQTSAPWKNLLAGSGFDLVDWTDIDAAEQLFSEMLDPNTGEPIVINVNSIVATPARRHALNRVLNATEIRYTASGSPTETLARNPISGYSPLTSQYLYSRLVASGLTADQAKATWFMGDPSRAFRYVENWPVTVTQAPLNSEAEFKQDIVFQFKASERGVAAVFNPRFMVKVNGYG
jgi:hypothetical protein